MRSKSLLRPRGLTPKAIHPRTLVVYLNVGIHVLGNDRQLSWRNSMVYYFNFRKKKRRNLQLPPKILPLLNKNPSLDATFNRRTPKIGR